MTSEEFSEFKKFMEEKLDDLEKKLVNLTKGIGKNRAEIDEALAKIGERIDKVSESSKSFATRLKEALKPESE